MKVGLGRCAASSGTQLHFHTKCFPLHRAIIAGVNINSSIELFMKVGLDNSGTIPRRVSEKNYTLSLNFAILSSYS